MKRSSYIMESDDEIRRLENKTGFQAVRDHAVWAGLKPGMRVADIGCGSGKTTACLKSITGPEGEAVGIDGSAERIRFALKNYPEEGLSFVRRDVYGPLDDLELFDFIWVRFFLEYHRTSQAELTRKFISLLAPGGIICLVDLDHNSMNHFGHSSRLQHAIESSIAALEKNHDFDPYAGRKLYSILYDLGLENLQANVGCHQLIYGELDEGDEFNWLLKVAVAGRDSGYDFPEYPGGFEEFYQECRDFFKSPRRFTYSPIIICRGTAPGSS